MSEEKQTPIGTMIVVAIAAGLIGYVIGKPTPPQVQAEVPDASEKPAEPQEPAFMKEGLVAYYPFNGNAKDESGNGNDGKEVNGPLLVEDRNGVPNSAYSFDGKDDSISIASSEDINPDEQEELTIVVWVNPKRVQDRNGILSKYQNPASNGYFIRIGPPDHSTDLSVGSFTRGYNDTSQISCESPATNKWQQIVFTCLKGKGSVFIDGKKKQSGQVAWARNNDPLKIGVDFSVEQTNQDRYFSGLIDDVRIYNRALSEEQVKAIYDWEKPKAEKPVEPQEPAFMKEGLVAYYPFNGNAKDESGNGNDGKVRDVVSVIDRNGKEDMAYSIKEKASIIEFNESLARDASEELTVCAWVSLEGYNHAWQMVVCKDPLGSLDVGFFLAISDGIPIFRINGTDLPEPENTNLNRNLRIGISEWNQIVGTFKNGQITLYVNGLKTHLVKSKFKVVTMSPVAVSVGSQQGKANWLDGSIDDVRIYNRALTEEQVKALYDWEKPKPE